MFPRYGLDASPANVLMLVPQMTAARTRRRASPLRAPHHSHPLLMAQFITCRRLNGMHQAACSCRSSQGAFRRQTAHSSVIAQFSFLFRQTPLRRRCLSMDNASARFPSPSNKPARQLRLSPQIYKRYGRRQCNCNPVVHRLLLEQLTRLLNGMNIVPIFLPSALHEAFFRYFMSVLRPGLHNVLETGSQRIFPGATSLEYLREGWAHFVEANEAVARVVFRLYQDGDVSWINDFQLSMMPRSLVKLCLAAYGRRPPQLFFLHAPFPTSEIFRTIPVRDDLLGERSLVT